MPNSLTLGNRSQAEEAGYCRSPYAAPSAGARHRRTKKWRPQSVQRKGRRSQWRAVSSEFRSPTPLKSTDRQCGHRANSMSYSTSIRSELHNNPSRGPTASEKWNQILRTPAASRVSTILPSRRADFEFEPRPALVRPVPSAQSLSSIPTPPSAENGCPGRRSAL